MTVANRVRKEMNTKHYCQCGCCQEVIFKQYFLKRGWAKYIHNHHMNGKIRFDLRKPIIINEKYFEYLLGVIHGDGSISKKELTISVWKEDKEYFDFLMKLIPLATNIEAGYYMDKSKNYVIWISSINLSEKMKCFKINSAWSIPELKYPEEWIAGCFDTDGCISKRDGSIHISQRIKENIVLLGNQLINFGINKFTVHTYKCKVYDSGFNREETMITRLDISAKESVLSFYEKIPIKHPRKLETINKMCPIVLNKRKPIRNFTNYWKPDEGVI